MPRSRPFVVATALFFLSGALGLGYELVWIRKAALVVGASQIALATVLTSFFLGLGLGSYVVGRYLRSRKRSPLFAYGVFEVVIGLFALAFPQLFSLLELAYGALYPLAAGSTPLLFTVRFTLLFFLVLVPTFFMGGTLPLLLDGLVAEDRAIGSRTSFLYGVNILGAVAGVLATCYFAIPNLGLNGTSIAGGVGNLLIGGAAIFLFRRHRPLHAADDAEEARLGSVFPAMAFASGLLAIAYQVVWARYFTLFHTTTIYFTAMLLAVYLLALAAGSLVLAPLLHARWHPLRILAWVQALVPLAALYTLGWWQVADYSVALMPKILPDGTVTREVSETLEVNTMYPQYFTFWSEELDAIFFAPLFQIALVIFLPVLLLGTGLPALIAAAARSSAGLRSISGRLVFWNTLGSSAGGFLSGYAFLHVLGLHWTLFALGLGSLALSLVAMWKSRSLPIEEPAAGPGRRARRHARAENAPRSRGLAVYAGLAGASALGIAAFGALVPDVTREAIRRWGYGRNPGVDAMELAEINEGPLTTTWIFEDENSIQVGAGHVSLAVTYKRSWSTQALQGHVPVLFYPGAGTPRDCLGICLGSGQSFGALLMYSIRRLDVVDISEEMVELSLERFAQYNNGLGTDERVSIHLDDGRHFVDRAQDGSYDVVSMEPPPPTADGVYSLYSYEFYEGVRRVLRTGGVFMQWLPLYRVTPLDARGIVKTQAAVFPHTFVVRVGRDDFMVLSYPERPVFEVDAIRERVKTFARDETFRRVAFEGGRRWWAGCRYDIPTFEGVLSMLITGPEDVARMEAPLVYRDDTQRLSYSSGDRHLLRLYRGPALSPVSFAALDVSSYAAMAPYFDPPLDPAAIQDLERERAAALGYFRVPEPERLRAAKDAYERSRDAVERARQALAIAALYDASLEKEEAYRWVELALRSHAALDDTASIETARAIVRNRIAVYAAGAEKALERLNESFRGAPILLAMRAELDAYRAREARRRAQYIFP